MAPEIEQERILEKGVVALPETSGMTIEWKHLQKTVVLKSDNNGLIRGSLSTNFRKGETSKVILNGISGNAQRGQVLAVMGPSGRCVGC